MDAFLTYEIGGNPLFRWALALVVATGLSLVLRPAQRLIERRLVSFSKRSENRVDDLIVAVGQRTKGVFLFVVALFAASLTLDLPDGWRQQLGVIMAIGLIIQVGFWANVVVGFAIQRGLERRANQGGEKPTQGALTLLGLLGRILVWSGVVLLVLDNLGVDITALVAGLGVGGVAAALALQNVLGDLFASFSIVLDKPFVVGDFIIVGELMGTVERIGLKTTRLRSLGGEQLIFANADLLTSRIRNYQRMEERRVVFEVGLVYQTPYELLESVPGLLRAAVESVPQTRFDRAHFKAYGDSALLFEVVYHVKSADYNVYMDIQQALNLTIFRDFQERGIEFAYPTSTIYLSQSAVAASDSASNQEHARQGSSSSTSTRSSRVVAS